MGLTYEDSKLYYRGEPVQFFDDVVAEYSTADTTEVMWYLNSDGNVVLAAERGRPSERHRRTDRRESRLRRRA